MPEQLASRAHLHRPGRSVDPLDLRQHSETVARIGGETHHPSCSVSGTEREQSSGVQETAEGSSQILPSIEVGSTVTTVFNSRE